MISSNSKESDSNEKCQDAQFCSNIVVGCSFLDVDQGMHGSVCFQSPRLESVWSGTADFRTAVGYTHLTGAPLEEKGCERLVYCVISAAFCCVLVVEIGHQVDGINSSDKPAITGPDICSTIRAASTPVVRKKKPAKQNEQFRVPVCAIKLINILRCFKSETYIFCISVYWCFNTHSSGPS